MGFVRAGPQGWELSAQSCCVLASPDRVWVKIPLEKSPSSSSMYPWLLGAVMLGAS